MLYLPEPSVCPPGGSRLEHVFAYPSTTVILIMSAVVAATALAAAAIFANSVVLLSIRYRDARTSSGPLLVLFLVSGIRVSLEAWSLSYPQVEPGRLHDTSIIFFSMILSCLETVALAWAVAHQHAHRVVRTFAPDALMAADTAEGALAAAPRWPAWTSSLLNVVAMVLFFVGWSTYDYSKFNAIIRSACVVVGVLKLWTVFLLLRLLRERYRQRHRDGHVRYGMYTAAVTVLVVAQWPVWALAAAIPGCAGSIANIDLALLCVMFAWIALLGFTLIEFRAASADLSWHALTQLQMGK